MGVQGFKQLFNAFYRYLYVEVAFTAANLTDQLTCENILENFDIGLLGYYLWLDKLTRRSGTILDISKT